MRRDFSQRLQALDKAVWARRPTALPRWKVRALDFIKLVVVLVRDLAFGQLTMRAMSLVYTTLLSIVPLLALSVSVLKAFGVHNQISPALHQFLAPLGEKGAELADRVLQFISNMNVGVLGSVGLAMLLYTSVSLVQKIEESLNYIWRVRLPRSVGERFSRYLSVLLVGPILVFSALGITASVLNLTVVQRLVAVQPFGSVLFGVTKIMPYLLVIVAFTFVYRFIPNTRVRFGTALIGGIVGGVLWQTAGWAFALFVASSTQYAAIYSSFAILILSLIWLYTSWLILLFGASVAFYLQHPEYLLASGGEPQLSSRMRERLALAAMSHIATHYLAGRAGFTLHALAQKLAVPLPAVEEVIVALNACDVLVRSSDLPAIYLPARDIGSISVASLLQAIRSQGEKGYLGPEMLAVPAPVEQALQYLQQAESAGLEGLTIKDLAAPLYTPV
ncbi:MAG: YihY/virulence factor BrkB family protein [Betaproteobacteria bacterium]